MNERIKATHLSRKAIVYIRQSSPHQVIHNEESRRLQYAMKERLQELGWAEVEVVDEDLGRTASGTVDRSGFEDMVAKVCLGKVGVVASRELSRFARNSPEWQKLIEVCRVVDTVLIDHETVYDSRRANDRLLLGLKGSFNEYELELLRIRSVEARKAKALRGELMLGFPVGYIKTDGKRLEKDPDKRVQKSVGLVFEKFLELGTVRQTLLWFLENGLDLPVRRFSVNGWETLWRRPKYETFYRILKNPIYAGIYAFGRTEVIHEYRGGKLRKRIRPKPKEEWLSLIPDNHEGYISQAQFDRIQDMISKNSNAPKSPGAGAAKKGPALLTGLLRCQRCGRKLTVSYTGRLRKAFRYICVLGYLDKAEPRCLGFGGPDVDEAMSREVFRVVQPASIEAAIQAGREVSLQQDEVVKTLRLELQEAQYASDRAWKQYDTADPENRLVTDELERRWNGAMEKVLLLETRIEEEKTRRTQVFPPDPESFKKLAEDFDCVWRHPETDVRIKKRIIRTLIEEVIVGVEADEVKLVIHWKGGIHTEINVRRRRRGENRFHTSGDVVDSVRSLVLICPDDLIAGLLNRNGLRSGSGNRWSQERVTSLRRRRKIAGYSPELQRREGWMNLTQAAAHVGLVPKTLRQAVERGEVKAMHPLPDGPWIFKREHLEEPGVIAVLESIKRRRVTPAGQTSEQLNLFKSTT